ncbi:MAG TPA: amidohydrolase [Saprospiraceae bacterium]|nr:amidohydrolase [Saprospiraceae bacterium]
MRTSFVQSNLLWENIEGNLRYFEIHMDRIAKESDIIILPEMFTTGFSMNVALAEEYPGRTSIWMSHLSTQYDSVIIGSVMIKEKDQYYNRCIIAKPDGTSLYYDKKHLFGYGHENNFYSAGDEKLIFEWKGWRICPLVCYDLRFPIWSRNVEPYYDLLIYIASWPKNRALAWKTLLAARAIENQAYVIGVNRIGQDGNSLNYIGDSTAINYLGEILNDPNDQEAMVTTVLDLESLKKFRTEFRFLNDGDQFSLN